MILLLLLLLLLILILFLLSLLTFHSTACWAPPMPGSIDLPAGSKPRRNRGTGAPLRAEPVPGFASLTPFSDTGTLSVAEALANFDSAGV
jgi:hypothetical protein